MRQLITESLLLALAGGAIGCGLGYAVSKRSKASVRSGFRGLPMRASTAECLPLHSRFPS